MNVRKDILHFLRNAPEFSNGTQDPEIWLAGLDDHAGPKMAEADESALRPAQDAAWRGLASNRAGLVRGPPGTGKTHLLAWFIVGYILARTAAGLPCRVLVSAFTRSAIGNLLDAVLKRAANHKLENFQIAFCGNAPEGGLSDGIAHYRQTNAAGMKSVAAELEQDHIIMGASIWSIYKLLRSGELADADGFTAPVFDLICIDEASQMPLTYGLIAMGGITPTGRLVVAGDNQQLPPIRVSREVSIEGREIGGSLYDFLLSSGISEFTMNETFRLNAPLTEFPSKQFYDHNFDSQVKNKRLEFSAGWETGLEQWEQIALDPQWPICILVHDGPPAATRNPFEAKIAACLAGHIHRLTEDEEANKDTRFWNDTLAIISPHRAHNFEIRTALGTGFGTPFVETVDRIQGRERDAVILSYCVADAEFALAEAGFIFAKERLNVATSRAGAKLVLIISRKLLLAVPGNQDILDQAELLREFVYDCKSVGSMELPDDFGRNVNVEIRVRGFVEDPILPELIPATKPEVLELELTDRLQEVLTAVVSLANTNGQYGTTTDYEVEKYLARKDVFPQLVDLQHLGWINLQPRTSKNGGNTFWSIRPNADQRRVFPLNVPELFERLQEVIPSARSKKFAPFYDSVRARFAWLNHTGIDIFLPLAEALEKQNLVKLGVNNKGYRTIDLVRKTIDTNPTEESELPDLLDGDFALLNLLEDLEASRINFGLFEGWTSPQSLADTAGRKRREVSESIARLLEHGYVMIADDQRLRSRMAELARELRYVKSRFDTDDAAKRPYLVRSLKLELRDRRKPERNVSLLDELEKLASRYASDKPMVQALGGLGEMLVQRWGENPKIAGFQARGLHQVIASWRGEGCDALVVAADTGSGKTEAACLPMFAAAAAERLAGNDGCFAVIAYPRIRLAANQAQRIVGYLAAYGQLEGMPLLTVGMQTGEVPKSLKNIAEYHREAGWEYIDAATLRFPMFTCPECSGELLLNIDGGVAGADRLACLECNWEYCGWIGSKQGLAQQPPNFFLPTTDSLHQWLQNPEYGALFGDAGGGPRVLLADEIHLYAHIHGAQVGHVFRRCLHRSTSNCGKPAVAIGMSATLGDPAKSWGRLVGKNDIGVIETLPNEVDINPRGREYFYFVQPEVESRGKDIAGASTTIQSVMCLAHGMRRRTGKDGGFRSLVFLDSIDKLRRMHSAYSDAEESKVLSSLRTHLYPDDPVSGQPRRECCGEPFGCDRFQNGECWYFAATDERQKGCSGLVPAGEPLQVSDRPVSSGAGGRVDELIASSDIIFSTSSLEVGFDDPEITMVYQHYAPQNLASFIQRKGRGGRGIDDRPITGVTLSIYSPRDSWWFRQPEAMIDPKNFDIAINPNNHFVLRGQVMAAFLDAAARHQFRTKRVSVDANGRPAKSIWSELCDYTEALYGPAIWEQLEFGSAEQFWNTAIENTSDELSEEIDSWCRKLEWIATPLFGTINLPTAEIQVATNAVSEDITLAFASTAPGNITRRYHPQDGYWIAPKNGGAPWFSPADYATGFRDNYPGGASQLMQDLPIEARDRIGRPPSPEIFRPSRITLALVGNFFGAEWRAETVCVPTQTGHEIRQFQNGDIHGSIINHESRGSISGFPVVTTDATKAQTISLATQYDWLARLEIHRGNGLGGQDSGLDLAQLYWAAESEVKLSEPGVDPVSFSQTFIDPQSNEPMLHGYRVRTEGVRFHVDSKRLDAFVAEERVRLASDDSARRWHSAQLMRYLVESRTRSAGLNGYEAHRISELFVAAAGAPELRKQLTRHFKFWDHLEFGKFLEEVRMKMLSQHPLLSASHVERIAQAMDGPQFAGLLNKVIEDVKDQKIFDDYLRSSLLQGLAQRLKQSFLLVGRGEERRILVHCKLPLQFGEAGDDVITVLEIGQGGDGTARAFAENIAEAEALWNAGFLDHCPSAEDDAVQMRFFDQIGDHPEWRQIRNDDDESLADLARKLGVGEHKALPQALLRILFDSEEIGAERISLFDLASETHVIAHRVSDTARRQASAWEITSAAVEQARTDKSLALHRLLTAYHSLDEANLDDSLSAEARLAEQIYRLSAKLCVDGCQACLHHGSNMMSDTLLQSSVSRQLLERFFVAP